MSARLYLKMMAAGGLVCIGGPALVYWVSPTEEELFARYSPDLQKRTLETQEQRQKDFDDFVTKLKKYSKSDKPIWIVAAEEEARMKSKAAEEQSLAAAQIQRRRDDIKKQSLAPEK